MRQRQSDHPYLFVSFEKWDSMFLLCNNIEGATEKVYQFHTPGAVFTTLYFICNLRNWPNKLECCIAIGWKILCHGQTLQFITNICKLWM
jgi:hypothetical protein